MGRTHVRPVPSPILRTHGDHPVRRPSVLAALAVALAFLPSASLALSYTATGRVAFSTSNASTTPSTRPFTSNTFGAAVQLPSGAAHQTFVVLKASPINNEYLAGYVTSDGVLEVLRYNVAIAAWTTEWSATVGGGGLNGRRFDIAYETATGRGLVVYSANAANGAMHYRVWDPALATWGGEQTFSAARLSGTANSVKLAVQPQFGSTRIAVAVADTSSYLSALVWDGSAWGSEPYYSLSPYPLQYLSTPGDADSFDLAFSGLLGDLTLAWAANPASPKVYTNRYTASTGAWLASTDTRGSGGLQVAVAADPSDDMIGVVVSSQGPPQSLSAVYVWDGSLWNSVGITALGYGTAAPIPLSGGAPRQRPFAAVWLTLGGGMPELVIPYSDAAQTTGHLSSLIVYQYSSWRSISVSNVVTWPTDGTVNKPWVQAVIDPGPRGYTPGSYAGILTNDAAAIVLFGDSTGSVWAKHVVSNLSGGGYPYLTVSDADGGAALTTSIGSTASQGFSFDYDHAPITILADNLGTEAATGTPTCAATPGSTTVYDLDHFTFATSTGSESVTKVAVKVTSGNLAVGTLSVTSDDGAITYGSLAYQASGSYSIPTSSSLKANTTPAQYRLQVTPALYSALPAGTNYTIVAKVVGFTSGLYGDGLTYPAGGDPSSGSVVVGRIPPAAPTWGTNSALPGQGLLSWANPASRYATTVIVRSASGSAVTNGSLLDGTTYTQGATLAGTPTDTVAYAGNGTSVTDNSGNAGGTYYYQAFAADACNNYSAGSATQTALTVPPVPNPTTLGPLVAAVSSCTGVTLTASYTGDGDLDNSVTVKRDGVAITCASLTRSASGNNGSWTCTDTVKPPGVQTYSYSVTFSDNDTVSGTNPLTATATVTACSASNGRVLFSAGTTSTPPSTEPYTWSSNSFGTPAQLPPGAANQTFVVLKASPINNEYLAGYVNTSGVLNVFRYNGTSWTTEWTSTVGGDGVSGRRFDIAYEKLTGRGLVVYSSNRASSSVFLRYRLWNPATGHWGTEQAFGSLNLAGTADWVKLASRPGTNEIAVGVMDTSPFFTALMWDGAAWGGEPSYMLSPFALRASSDSFDLAYSSLSGDLIVAWCTGGSYLYTNQFQRASGSWLASSTSYAAGNSTYQVVVAADPLSDKVGVVVNLTGSSYGTINAKVWTGSVWNAPVNVTNQISSYPPKPSPNLRQFAAFWLNIPGTSELIVPYQEQPSSTVAGKLDYAYSTDSGKTTFSPSSASITWPGPTSKVWFQAVMDPGSPDRAMVLFSDSAGKLWAKGVVLGLTWLDKGTYTASGALPTSNAAGLPSPTNLAFTSGTGSMTAGTYWYRVTAVNAAGETLPSAETSLTVASSGAVNVNWTPVAGATGYKIYGRAKGGELFITNVSAAPVLNFTDADGGAALTSSLASTSTQNFAFDYDHPRITVFGDNLGLEAVTGSPACASTATSTTFYDLDHFTLSASVGNDTVSKVTVSVSSGNGAVGALYVTTDTGVVLGSLGYQASGSYAIPVSIQVNTTATQYHLQVKPAPFSALPSGANYPISANVVSIAAGNAVGGSDPSNGSVIVDRVPPAAPAWAANTTAPGQVFLNWLNPGTDYASTVILRSGSGQAVATSALYDGSGFAQGQSLESDTVAYGGSGTSATDSSGAGTFLYRAFAADACNNYSVGATSSAVSPPAILNQTTVVAFDAAPASCTAVTLAASFTGDGNGNNGVSFTRDGNPVCVTTSKRTASGNIGTWTCTDTVPSANATYSYSASFTDGDPVYGATPLTVTVVQSACPANGGTLSLGSHSSGISPSVSANPGQTNVLAGRFSLTANASGTGGSVSLTQIALASGGTATSADLASLNVYADLGGTVGSWDPGDQLAGTASWSAGANAWVLSGFNVPLGTTSYILTLSPAYGATPGRTFTLSFSTASVSGGPGISVVGAQAITGGTVTIASNPVGQKPGDTASMSQKPMVLILNPASGATMSLDNSPASKGVRVQVQVYDPSHTTIGSVKLSHDGGQTFPDALALNPSYDPVVNQGGAPYYAHVYQADLTTIPAGSWTLQAMVITSGGGAGYSAPITVSVNAKSVGDGNLLVRNDSNQLCIDCHTLQTHSSQSVSSGSGISKFGSWATSCRDCHTPHKTHNAQLLRESIVPPAYSSYQTAKAVRFWDRITGDSGTVDAISFVSSSAPLASGTLGPCQACHTRTGGAIARWRNTGNSDSHFAGAGTAPCTKCHSHSNGFGGQESLGGQSCGTCHSSKFWNMQASGTPTPALPRLTKHTLGASVQGTNDSFQNPSLSWTSPLSANAPASRSCVGMCHGDHVHNDPAAWPTASHANNLYANAATQASRSLTRDANLGAVTYGFATSASTGSLLAASDFTSGQYTKGCLACHVNQVDTSHPGLSGAAYDASAHNVSVTPTGLPWEYVLHDGSRFVRNCTKCHAGNQAEGQATSYRGSVQGVHYSDNPSLLAGAIRPAGNAASNVCYNCHGNGVIGVNNSNKDVASEVARGGSAHPVNGDTSHDTLAEAALTWGNALGSNSAASRHASCLDCHDPHLAQPSVNDSRVIAGASGNLAAPAIAGVSGARLSGSLAAWTAPAASNFTVVPTISAGSEVEATLCFKCHSSFYWGNDAAKIPTSPSGGFKETDQALEFNPSNRWFHPVLAPTPTPTNNILPPWTTTSRMRCTDCHSSDRTADPGGPHGSAAKYLLKGPNTEWNAGITLANRANYKIFCANCHNVGTFNKSRFSWDFLGTSGNNHTSNHNNSNMRVQCFACHSAIPHGGPRPGGLIAPAGAGAGIPAQTAYDTSPPYSMGTGYRLGLVSYPVTGWDKPNCGCDGLIH